MATTQRASADTLIARPSLRSLVDDLHERREQARLGGGEEKIAQQHERDKLTARERLALLIDEGTFSELGIHGRPHFSQRAMEGREAPADGVITGYGKVDGRLVAVAAYDFTVMAGSMGMTGELKVSRLRELALGKRIPLIWLLDSAGARIQEAAGSLFAGSGHLFREEVVMSGVVPQVAALHGPLRGRHGLHPGPGGLRPDGQGPRLDGPRRPAPHEGGHRRGRDPGGAGRLAGAHARVGGGRPGGGLRRGVHPGHQGLPRPLSPELRAAAAAGARPPTRSTAATRTCSTSSPTRPATPTTCTRSSGASSTTGEWFDLKPRWARTIITCLARMGGRPVGIVANQPRHLGGILENDSADKAARFINLCDAYGIPLLFLMDVPGFMVGTKVEQAGIIRHGAKMLYAVSRATVPKVTVIVRKAYGAGYYVMCGKAYEPDLIVAWPSAEISVMGPEGAVNIIFRKQIEASEDPDATRAEMIEGIRATIDPYIAAGNAMIDDVIDPRETRPTVIRALEMAETKRVARPQKKHGVMPV